MTTAWWTQERAAMGPQVVCETRGCGRSVLGGENGMCVECADMDRQYDAWYARRQVKQRERIGRRLRTTALVLAFVTLMSWLAMEMAPGLWVAFKVWHLSGSN